MTEKHKLEPAINLKQTTSKNTWPRWVGIWARDAVKWHWSADTQFWHLSIDHNNDVYYQVKHRLQPPTPARIFDISQWFACGADEWVDGRTVTRLPKFLRWIDYQIFLGMGLRLRARASPYITIQQISIREINGPLARWRHFITGLLSFGTILNLFLS